MAPLSLKIVLDDGAVTRTIAFDSGMKVSQAHDVVSEKVSTPDNGRDHSLFMTSADNPLSGIWLEGFRTLEYYMLRDGDSLHYLNRLRNLRVRMLDGSVKTILVDESKCLGDLMLVICHKIGITNHDEYGLCHEEVEETDEAKETKPATGTLTLKRKAQQKERDLKMEQLSKKLKTDDNVEWLDHHKTLREMGVDPKETLLLKRRLFYSDRNVDSRDPVQLNLLYVQIRNAILDGRHPVTENEAADCKIRWVNIRDVNRRILRKSLTSPDKRVKNYKYENELAFMRPFYKDVFTRLRKKEEYDYDEFTEQEAHDIDEEMDSSDSDEDLPIIVQEKRKTKKRLKNNDYTSTQTVFEEPPPVAAVAEFDPADPVDAFLMSVGTTLKTFSPYHLNLAKSKIFAIVQEHDLQQIVQRQGHSDIQPDKSSESSYLQQLS